MARDPFLLDDFLQFEEKNSVFDLQIDGVPIWERLRHKVYSSIITDSDDTMNEVECQTLPDFQKYINGVWLWGKNLVHKNPYFAGEHDYLFWGHQRRKLLDDDLWWDIYFDPLYDEVNFDYIHLEVAHWEKHFTPAKTPVLRYMDFPIYSGTIAKKLFSSHYPLDDSDRATLNSITEALHNEFDVHIDLIALVKKVIIQRRVRKPLYRLLLDQIFPKVVVLIVSYHRETFIETCKEMDIPVVELQHGAIHSHHLGYSYPGSRSKQTFPDHLLVYGDYWKDAVEYPIPDKQIHSVGYPYLEMQNKRYSDLEPTKQVVFISQPAIGSQLTELAIKFSELSDRQVIYKLHPHEYNNWQNRYPSLETSDVRVVHHSPPLYELLAGSAVQVGVNSTVLYEGLKFNLKTFLFNDVDIYLSQLEEMEYVTLISNAEELQNALTTDNHSVDENLFFKKNAIQNMQKVLVDISNTN